jgi:hypothetical protein
MTPPNHDDPSNSSRAGRPAVIFDEEDLGMLGYLAWLHHAMWCPNRLAAIPDPLGHFQDLDARMTARVDELTARLPAGSDQTWQARRTVQARVVAQMGTPPREVDQPVWVPDDNSEDPDGPLAAMTDAINLLDEAVQAIREGRDPTAALAELDRQRTPGRD